MVLRPSVAMTPGWSRVSCMKLRPFSGSSRASSPVTRPETSAPTVLTATAATSTSTTSATPPVSSCTSTLRTSATLSVTLLRASVLKPGDSTSIR